MADIGLHGHGLEQRDRFGDEVRGQPGAAEVDGRVRCGDVPRVERYPLPGSTGGAKGDGHIVAGDRVDDRQAVGIDLGHIERDHGIGRARKAGIGHGE
ncbi:hypothetical protein D3C80_2020780 [compost metagenome]